MTECLLIDCRGVTPEQYQGILALIPQERRELAESFRHFSDKVMSAVSALCQQYVMIRSGGEVFRDSGGKPQCTAEGFHFNISHSGLFVLLAMSDNPVGADIQTLITEPEAGKWVLSPAEKEILGPSCGASDITEIWCRKESVLKMTGNGLRLDPRTVNILDPDYLQDGYSFFEKEGDGFCICICQKGECRISETDIEFLADYVDPRFRLVSA